MSKSHDNFTLQKFMWEIHILMWKADITYLKILDWYIENVLWVTVLLTLCTVYNTSVPGTQKNVACSFLPQYHMQAPTSTQVPRAHVKFCTKYFFLPSTHCTYTISWLRCLRGPTVATSRLGLSCYTDYASPWYLCKK